MDEQFWYNAISIMVIVFMLIAKQYLSKLDITNVNKIIKLISKEVNDNTERTKLNSLIVKSVSNKVRDSVHQLILSNTSPNNSRSRRSISHELRL